VRPPPDNRPLLARLLADGALDLAADPAALLPAPDAGPLDWDRVEGMLLGLAIGDALGNTSEGMVPRERRALLGQVDGYLPNRWAGGRRVGLPSDDTQLAFWTLRQLLQDGGLVPDHLAERFRCGRIFGMGGAVRAFRQALEAGEPWLRASRPSAGNGALMRIAPVILPHLRAPSAALWADAALAGAVTHNDRLSTGSCVALVRLLWACLHAIRPPPHTWWVETFAATLRPLEGEEPRYAPRHPGGAGLRVRGWQLTHGLVVDALGRGLSTREACDAWLSGAYLLETLPSVLHILELHGSDPEEAVLRAVNDTTDNDTIAALVGAAVGALHGAAAFPEPWVEGLLGRTAEADDGAVFGLLDAAAGAFAPG
jgi:ADP-ribosylglycohydrolase